MFNKIFQTYRWAIIWLIVLFVFPVSSGILSSQQIVFALIYILLFGATGSVLLSYSKVFNENFIFWGSSYFLGAFVFGFIYILFDLSVNLLWLIVPGILLLFYIRVIKKAGTLISNYNDYSVLLSIFLVVLFCYTGVDYIQAQSIFPVQEKDALPDPFFFTLLTNSLSRANPFNSFYDVGAPINYQTFSFLPPAIFAKFSTINAQISLWSFWMPFYKVFSISIIAHAILSFNKAPQKKWYAFPLVVVLLFTLAPINPKYLLSLDIKNIIWLGDAYLLPGGNPPFTASFCIVGAILLLLSHRIEKWSLLDKFILHFLLAVLIGFKTAMFIPMGVLTGIYSIFVFKQTKNPTLLLLTISSLPTAYIFYKLIIYGNSSGLVKIVIEPLYYIEYIGGLTQINNLPATIGLFIIVILIWGGIRFFVLGYSLYKNKDHVELIVSFIIAFFISLSIPLVFRYYTLTPDGKFLDDVSFDLRQFVRAAFFLSTIISIIVLVQLVNCQRRLIVSIIVPIILVSFLSLILKTISFEFIEEDQTWRNEIRAEFNQTKPVKLAMLGTSKYHSQLLAAEGIGPWWFSVKRGNQTDYLLSNKNFYRSEIVLNFLSKENPIDEVLQMRKEGVDYFVAHPDNKQILDSLKMKNLVFQDVNNKWLYRLSK